jgi:putative ABC transport system permease protein
LYDYGTVGVKIYFWQTIISLIYFMLLIVVCLLENQLTTINAVTMLKNFFILAIRNLLKSRTTSMINILGFSLGITCCLVIYFKVNYELSFDTYHTDSKNTFRVVRQTKGLGLNLAEGEWEYREGVFGALPGEIRADIPEVRTVAAVMQFGTIVKIPDPAASRGFKLFRLEEGGFVEPSFFQIFDFKGTNFRWMGGSAGLLKEPNSVVLTQQEADRYFPGQDAMGKTIVLFDNINFTVTGLITDLPANSDFPFKIFVSYASLQKLWKGFTEDWNNLGNNQCFIVLGDATQQALVESKIKNIYAKHASKDELENRIFKLQPIHAMHSDSRFGNFNNRVVRREILLALWCVGIFIIIIASINYAILALSRSGLRMREVGIRKVFGSNRRFIIGQFIGESFILTLIALNIGMLCTKLILALSPSFIGIPVAYPVSFHGLTLVFSAVLLIIISIISGSFPALIVSAVQPIDIIKHKFLISQTGKLNFTRLTVILQFTISLIMIISTITVYKQLRYLENMDPGYNKDAVFTVGIPNHDPVLMDRFKSTLLKNPLIAQVSFGSSDPAQPAGWTDISRFENQTEKRIVTQIVAIDTSYIETYQLHLVAGRNIRAADSGRAVLVNQQLVKEMNFNNSDDAVDAQLNLFGDEKNKVTIAGVLKDYYYETLRNKVRPSVLVNRKEWSGMAGIRPVITGKEQRSEQLRQALKFTRDTWQSIYPDNLYDYTFIEDRLNAYYRSEHLISQLFNVFSLITIFIGCLGIFGLAYYTCEQKSKEIAVRKTNGASIGNILMILSKNYAWWLGIAFLIACPVAWYIMHAWLQGFAYKTAISWWVFILGGILSLTVAGMTVSWQSYQAARKNPVDALKYE